MSDKNDMFRQILVRSRIRHAEDPAQASNPVQFKHFHVYTSRYAVLYFSFRYIEIIIGQASVLHTLVMIRDIPFFCNAEAVRQQIDGTDDPPEEIQADLSFLYAKTMIYSKRNTGDGSTQGTVLCVDIEPSFCYDNKG